MRLLASNPLIINCPHLCSCSTGACHSRLLDCTWLIRLSSFSPTSPTILMICPDQGQDHEDNTAALFLPLWWLLSFENRVMTGWETLKQLCAASLDAEMRIKWRIQPEVSCGHLMPNHTGGLIQQHTGWRASNGHSHFYIFLFPDSSARFWPFNFCLIIKHIF